jgi:transposase
MSMKPQEISPVLEETARVARVANPKGNVYMHIRDELGSLYLDQMVAALFPRRGQPAEAPWRLALVTVMQYMEDLSDRQAAEAVRERIDWKYALSLELTDPGFDFSVLSEFRTRLLAGGAERQLLQALMCKEWTSAFLVYSSYIKRLIEKRGKNSISFACSRK